MPFTLTNAAPEPQPGDIAAAEHWGSSGFANTDLDLHLKKHSIHKLIIMGLIAHTYLSLTSIGPSASTGTPADSEDAMRFAELTGVRPMIETYPLEKAAEAYACMMSGNAQSRVVLMM